MVTRYTSDELLDAKFPNAEGEEREYRRGYCDGWEEAISQIEGLLLYAEVPRRAALDMMKSHLRDRLTPWQFGDCREEVTPPVTAMVAATSISDSPRVADDGISFAELERILENGVDLTHYCTSPEHEPYAWRITNCLNDELAAAPTLRGVFEAYRQRRDRLSWWRGQLGGDSEGDTGD